MFPIDYFDKYKLKNKKIPRFYNKKTYLKNRIFIRSGCKDK